MANPKKKKEKTNKRTTKLFFKLLAGLVCLLIVCAATNKIFDALAETAAAQNAGAAGSNIAGSADTQNQQYADAGNSPYYSASPDSQSVGDAGGDLAADPNAGVQGDALQNGTANGNVQTPAQSGNNNAAAPQAATNPLQFNKAQIVNYYNQCLRNTYKQPKFTVTKTERISVQLGKLLLDGKQKDGIQSIANDLVKKNSKNETTSKTFTGGNPQVTAERYILPVNLVSSGVKDGACSITPNGSGYTVKFELVAEDCDFRTKPRHNNSCTFPLDFTEIDLGGFGEITDATFHYPGTKLTANIDAQGRVTQTYVEMPLTVKNASGQGKGVAAGFKVSVDISGTWYCTNKFAF